MEKDIPEELKNLWLEKEAADSLKESYIKRPLGFKKALKCAELSKKKADFVWSSLRKLYPELGPNLQIDTKEWKVLIYNPKEKP